MLTTFAGLVLALAFRAVLVLFVMALVGSPLALAAPVLNRLGFQRRFHQPAVALAHHRR